MEKKLKTGIELIAEERKWQIEVEGWTVDHDKEHDCAELAFAAATYAPPSFTTTKDFKRIHLWPWDKGWWKPSDDRIKELTKAGALIAAEIDRLNAMEG
jgi:hypothetical protein